MKTVFDYDEIFQDVDEETCLLKIPEEICIQLNWTPGDTIHISASDGIITLTKVEKS